MRAPQATAGEENSAVGVLRGDSLDWTVGPQIPYVGSLPMPRKICVLWIILSSALMVLVGPRSILSQQNEYQGLVLKSQVNDDTAVRFFYDPPLSDYFHPPLVLRATHQGDARLSSPPKSDEGWIAYVSFAEMRQLMQGLTRLGVSWEESEKIESFGSFKQLARRDSMEVTVLSSSGTAEAKVRPMRICDTLKRLESALKAKRALWEFGAFELNHSCKVPAFDPYAYPDRR